MPDSSLTSFVESVNGSSRLRIETDFGDGFVRLQTSEAERRQAIQDIRCTEDIVLELLRNARDAHAAHIFLAVSRDEHTRRLVVVDDGEGIPSAMHARIFEPRVTSKLDTSHLDKWGLHGRGMALYSIAENAASASIASSTPGLGTALAVETDLRALGEKTDQSTFPTFELSESGTVSVRGPRNVLRCACEFAIEARSHCAVFVGSTTEIAAALYQYGLSTLSAVERVFCSDITSLALCKRLATAPDPATLAAYAKELGLDLSDRSARRIMDGAIEPAEPLLDRIAIAEPAKSGSKGARDARQRKAARALHLGEADRAAFVEAIKGSYADLARSYYLEPDVEPSIHLANGTLRVSIPLVLRLD